nr:P-loop NTPase fold protein [Pseudomonas subflava]
MLANPDIKVLNVNSPWGSGKSFFLQRWCKALSQNHVCIYFNAWENDFAAEPLVVLVTSIEEQAADPLDIQGSSAGRGLVKGTSELVKSAAPLIAKGLFKKYLGCEMDQVFGEGAGGDGADATSELVGRLIKEQAESKDNIQHFKDAVKNRLSQAAVNQGKKSPAFIFIDELDRCRPTYAVELLERVKHFFEIEDCRFIVASDSEQLSHSICAIYGEKFQSQKYLRRFFDAEYRLDQVGLSLFIVASTPELNDFGHLVPYRKARTQDYASGVVFIDLPTYPVAALFFYALAKFFNFEARDVLRCIRQTKAVCDALKQSNYDVFWAAFLVFMHNSSLEFTAKDIILRPSQVEAALQKIPSVCLNTNPKPTSIYDLVAMYLQLMNNPEAVWNVYNTDRQLPQWKDGIYSMYMRDSDALKRYVNLVELAGHLA